MNSKKLYISIIILFLILFLAVFFVILNTHLKMDLHSNKKIVLNDFNYRTLHYKTPEIVTYERNISKTEFNKISKENLKIIIYRLTGQSYKVYFNNILIGSLGCGVNSNIWNSINNFDIDKTLIKENNTLKIFVTGLYEVGLLSVPMIITTVEDANSILNWFNLLINLYIMAIGCLLVCFMLLLFFSFSQKTFNLEYFFFALSAVFLAIYVFDSTTVYKINFGLLLFKKIEFSSLFISIAFISFAVYQHFKNRIALFSGFILLISAFLIVFSGNDLFVLKRMATVFSALIFINLILWIVISLINIKKSDFSKIFLSLCVIALVLAGFDITLNFFEKTNLFNLFCLNIYTFIFFSISMTILVFFDYMNLLEKIIYETEKAKVYYEMATKDQMTDCFNHQFIVNTLKEMRKNYVLVMFDIDNFKPINDTFGHQTGDYVIKFIANEIKKNVRTNDLVGRYGGDEFIAILPECSEAVAKEISSRILENVRAKNNDDKGNILKLSLSIGIYNRIINEKSEIVLSKVDKALYQSKTTGKNRITVFA